LDLCREEKEIETHRLSMRGNFWNIRGLNTPDRNLYLGNLIRSHRIDFIRVQETKKYSFHPSFLKNLTTPATFKWDLLPTNGTARGILLGVGEDTMDMVNIKLHTFAIFYILNEKNQNFSWTLLVVYGPAYEDRKV
jgi:hypothetical protein